MEFMVKYNAAELAALVRLVLALEKKLNQVGVHLHSYHGAGAIASYFLSEPNANHERVIPMLPWKPGERTE